MTPTGGIIERQRDLTATIIAPGTDLHPSRSRRARAADFRRQSPWLVLAIVVVLLVLLPVVPLQIMAFSDGGAGFADLAALPNLGRLYWQTFALGVGSLVVSLVLGTLLALSMNVMPPRARRYLSFTPVLPIIIPAVAHVVGFVFLFSPEAGYINTLLRQLPMFAGETGPVNVYTPFWIIMYTGLNLASFVYLFVYTGLRNLGPEYVLAARANGAGGFRALMTITLPLLRPSFIYAGSVCFLLALGQFTGPLILGRREGLDVLTTRMFNLMSEYPVNFGLVAALGTPMILVAFVLVFAQRRLIGDQDRFVGQASAMEPAAPGRGIGILATVFVLAFTLLSAILPLLALLFVSLSPFWQGDLSLANLTFAHYESALSNPVVLRSINTSLTSSVIGVVLAVPLGMLIALAVYNKDRLWRPLPAILDIAASLPLTLPAALMGFGFLFAFSSVQIGIYGTPWSLSLAYLVLMIPFSVRYQLAALVSVGRQTMESSRANGAGPIRTFAQITFPLARAGVAASAAIMFVLLIHEFGVSLLLRSPSVTVMSVLLFDQYDGGSYPAVAVIAILMTGITALGVIVALVVGGKRAFERL